MKRAVLILLIMICGCSLFAQESTPPAWKGLVRFKPAATAIGLIIGMPEVIVDWVPYVTPTIGIPVEIDVAYISGSFSYGVLAGVEGVFFGSQDKNGLYAGVLAGVYNILGTFMFGGHADIGYQIVTDFGLVFTPAAGFKFNTLTGFSLDLMLDLGFAYR
jgi:hypothetical protein